MKKNIGRLCVIIAVLAVISICYGYAKSEEALEVELAEVKIEEIVSTVEAGGIVEEAEYFEVFTAEHTMIHEIFVDDGSSVRVGDMIAVTADGRKITSPVEGRVKYVASAAIAAGTGKVPVMVIGNAEKLKLSILIPEKNITDIAVGQKASFTCAAAPGRSFYGEVSGIAKYAKQITGTRDLGSVVEVSVDIKDEIANLKPGFTAEVSIVTKVTENAVTVPFEAVMNEDETCFVWIVSDGKAVRREVSTGIETDLVTEITEGLSAGETVIVNPPQKLQNHMPITEEKMEGQETA